METLLISLLVGLLGAAVGLAEILNRYQKNPWAAAVSWAGILYVVINAIASLAALGLMRALQLNSGGPLQESFIAGFAAMAVLRSGIVWAQSENRSVTIGPAWIVQVFLSTAHYHMNKRVSAQEEKTRDQEASEIGKLLTGLPYDQVRRELLNYSLFAEISSETAKTLRGKIDQFHKESLEASEQYRLMGVGFIIDKELGMPALRRGVSLMRALPIIGPQPEFISARPVGVTGSWDRDTSIQVPATVAVQNVETTT